MFKKLFLSIAIVVTLLMPFAFRSSAYADEAIFKGRTDNCNLFLGLTSWDCGVEINSEHRTDGKLENESLKSGIWTIAANIATDITIIAAYLVLGYVIYGGYLYTFSSGDPSKVASGKKTLFHAFLGLAIVMSAYLIMSTIRLVLLGESGNLADCVNISDTTGEVSGCIIDANTVVTSAIGWFIGIAGLVSAIFVVYGGISYITSAGDPGKVAKAKQMILYALIGLAIVGLASAITAFVSNMIRNANKKSALEPNYSNAIIISKGNI